MFWGPIIRRKVVSLVLEPIRVFCLHHVSEVYRPEICSESDWISSDDFMSEIVRMKKEYEFISLEEAFRKIRSNYIRFKKYAVLTFDDGYASPLQIFKWLDFQKIPYTLFLNSRYMDGKSGSNHIVNRLKSFSFELDEEDIWKDIYLTKDFLNDALSPCVSFGSHGFEHLDATTLSENEFQEQIDKNLAILKALPQFIPFHAYTWGRHNCETDDILRRENLIPVLMDGQKNYNNPSFIHRELFPAFANQDEEC